jgi:antitoxin HicB
MRPLTYTIVLERNEDNGYTVTVPALKGCVTQGSTIAESLTRAREAIECFVEALAALGKRVPSDSKVIRLAAGELTEALVFKITAYPDLAAARAEARVA